MSLSIINPFVFAASGGGGGEEYGITAASGWVTNNSTAQQRGWEFQVGGSDIEVTALRFYGLDDGDTVQVLLFDEDSQAKLAEVAVTTVANDYASTALGSPITLSAGANYIIVSHQNGQTDQVAKNPTSYTVNPAITYVQSRFWNTRGAFPFSTTSAEEYVAPDIIFTT